MHPYTTLLCSCCGHAFVLQTFFFAFKLTCREVWPDDVFGKSGMSVDEEMEAIRSLFVHPLSGKHGKRGVAPTPVFARHLVVYGTFMILSVSIWRQGSLKWEDLFLLVPFLHPRINLIAFVCALMVTKKRRLALHGDLLATLHVIEMCCCTQSVFHTAATQRK